MDPKSKFAVKVLEKNMLSMSNIDFFNSEVKLLKAVDHPNIVRFWEIYHDDKNFYLVMEFCYGKNINEKILDDKFIGKEDKIAPFMYKIFSAIKYLHIMGIAHRDIKPENILMDTSSPDLDFKIIDFGLSRYLGNEPCKKLSSKVGTLLYTAPEIIDGKGYDEKCDLWGLGVILYIMMSKKYPFKHQSTEELVKAISKGQYESMNNNSKVWRNISKEGKDLIKKLLITNPKQRLCASQALEHPWFKRFHLNYTHFDISTLNDAKSIIEKFVPSPMDSPGTKKRKSNFLKSEAIKLIVNFLLSASEQKKLRQIFDFFDIENTGYISADELEQAMKELGYQFPSKESILSLIKNLHEDDQEDRETLNYTEFISIVMDKKALLTDERIWRIFVHFDTDKSGHITHQNIRDVLSRMGRDASDEEITQIIKEFDKAKDGQISFQEFVQLLVL